MSEIAAPEGNEAAVDLEDIPPHFHEVVKKYGRDMYFVVMHAAMGAQAAVVLNGILQKHASRGGLHALGMLIGGFNFASNTLAKDRGWTEEEVAQCDRDCQLAARTAIIPAGSRILLNS